MYLKRVVSLCAALAVPDVVLGMPTKIESKKLLHPHNRSHPPIPCLDRACKKTSILLKRAYDANKTKLIIILFFDCGKIFANIHRADATVAAVVCFRQRPPTFHEALLSDHINWSGTTSIRT